MSIEEITAVLGWCTIINTVVLTVWFAMFCFLHDWIYQIHSKWFTITQSQFNAIHYGGMGLFKLTIFVLNLAPYIALKLSL